MKKQTLIAGAALATIGGACVLPVGSAEATKFQPNTDTLESPFVIRSVQPSTSKITVSYNGGEQGYEPLRLINIQAINFDVGATEDQIDENLPWLEKATPYWNKTIFYEEIYSSPKIVDYGPAETELTNARYPRVIDLDVEPAHILYYAVRPGEDYYGAKHFYGKINYSLCMKSAVYKPGVECRAENKETGGVWYWPYYNGERLEVPEEEWDDWGIKPKPKPQPTPGPTPSPQADVNTTVAVPTVATTTGETHFADQATQTDTTETVEQTPVQAATPEQIEVPTTGDEESNFWADFPWWIVIVILGAGIGGLSIYFYVKDRK